MVTLTTAENALKTVYLGVLANQLNVNANPLLGKIKQTTSDVWGKEIVKMAPFGINGGIGAGSEDGQLPKAGGNNYAQFKSTLKNLYGVIEISDKAVRASLNSAGAFVNLLNNEMEELIKSSSYNMGRMLYGDGSGKLTACVATTANNTVINVADTRNLIEGMTICAVAASGAYVNNGYAMRIKKVDKANKKIYVDGEGFTVALTANHSLAVQGSLNNELTGLEAIFDSSKTTLYGLSKSDYPFVQPYVKSDAGVIDESLIQSALDEIEESTGNNIDFISTTYALRRAFQEYLGNYRRFVDTTELAGGFKAISYNGIPVVADKFVASGDVYLLNTKDFAIHQLCDWQWLEGEDGRVIKQKNNYPAYTATLVKYADLICDRPGGQGKLSGVTTETKTDTSNTQTETNPDANNTEQNQPGN